MRIRIGLLEQAAAVRHQNVVRARQENPDPTSVVLQAVPLVQFGGALDAYLQDTSMRQRESGGRDPTDHIHIIIESRHLPRQTENQRTNRFHCVPELVHRRLVEGTTEQRHFALLFWRQVLRDETDDLGDPEHFMHAEGVHWWS